jgi:hypothetical protein
MEPRNVNSPQRLGQQILVALTLDVLRSWVAERKPPCIICWTISAACQSRSSLSKEALGERPRL